MKYLHVLFLICLLSVGLCSDIVYLLFTVDDDCLDRAYKTVCGKRPVFDNDGLHQLFSWCLYHLSLSTFSGLY